MNQDFYLSIIKNKEISIIRIVSLPSTTIMASVPIVIHPEEI